ncbi:MAG: hypothetical protein F6K09_00940 [Merismopedia sp. SIO2A8]|nr:hypothetical protein [Symploca sp. SIO2E9]NET08267.1 hypothetical protein [Symploca sp. SIO2B6]NET47297.1 hypothetical protein [Merismopedia sp. SIO2A8]
MRTQLIEILQEFIEAVKPFSNWKAYPESAVLTEVIRKAQQVISSEEV